jgi:Asp/Glu/hydantoin racemase
MRLLLLNPNTSQSVTDRIAAAARAVAGPGTELIPVTAPRGVPYIATRAEATIGGAVALELLADLQGRYDVAVIAAFGDPGLGGARELFPVPVIGLAEAGMLTACMLGRSFAIVTFSQSLEPWYEECVAWHGLRERCAGVHALPGSFQSISGVQDEKEDLLVELAQRAVDVGHADVVVLAGAPLAGLARRVRERIPVPVVDCVEAAVKQAEALAALGPRKAERGTFRRPAAKPTLGLHDALGAWIAHQ